MQPTDDTTFTHYDRLGVSQEADPKRSGTPTTAWSANTIRVRGPPAVRKHLKEVTRDLRAARDVLLDPRSRSDYDQALELEQDLRELDLSGVGTSGLEDCGKNPPGVNQGPPAGVSAPGADSADERDRRSEPASQTLRGADSGPFSPAGPGRPRPRRSYNAVPSPILARVVPILAAVAVGWAWWIVFVAAVVVSGGIPFAVSLPLILLVRRGAAPCPTR